jgi:hypothetical protein
MLEMPSSALSQLAWAHAHKAFASAAAQELTTDSHPGVWSG